MAGFWSGASIPLGVCVGLPSGLLEHPDNMAAGFVQNKMEAIVAFMTSSQKSHSIMSTVFYCSHRLALSQCGRTLHKDVNSRRQGIFGGWLSRNTTFFIDMTSLNLHNKSLRLISILQRKKLRLQKDKGLSKAQRFSLIPGPHSFSPICFSWTQQLSWADSAGLKGWKSSGKRLFRAA